MAQTAAGPEIARILVLFSYALLFAAVEIEIEGADGWAHRLPTWVRRRTRFARWYGLLMGGRPLTGYHLVMFLLPLVSFHIPFVSGVTWSWTEEARTLAAYLAWAVVWDFLWFLLNPAFGWARFRRGQVWWHEQRWIGRFPIDYYRAFGLSFVVAASAGLSAGSGLRILLEHGRLALAWVVLTALVGVTAPLYHRWYRYMRRPGADEREPDTGEGPRATD
jgi:hypothetical protein